MKPLYDEALFAMKRMAEIQQDEFSLVHLLSNNSAAFFIACLCS